MNVEMSMTVILSFAAALARSLSVSYTHLTLPTKA